MASKVKRSVTLDADLVERFGDDNLSQRVNELLRREVQRDLRAVALGRLLDRLEAEDGPPPDARAHELEVRTAMELGGATPAEIEALSPPLPEGVHVDPGLVAGAGDAAA